MSANSGPRSPTLSRSDDSDGSSRESLLLARLPGSSQSGYETATTYSPEKSFREKVKISTSPTPGAGPSSHRLLQLADQDQTPVAEFVDWLSGGELSLAEENFLIDYFDNIWRLQQQWMNNSWMNHHLTYVRDFELKSWQLLC